MKTDSKTSQPPLKKVASGLYRNQSSGAHYAKFKANGNQVYENLGTTDEAVARRKLRSLRVQYEDFRPKGQGSTRFIDRCELYVETIQGQARSTITGKIGVVNRIKETFPETSRSIHKIRPTECETFLAQYKGQSRHRQALNVLREIFRQALADGMISKSAVEGLKQRKPSRPIRYTPSEHDFLRIVQSIREQRYSDTADETADFVEFMGLGGIGRKEASEVEWRHLDFKANRITLFRHKTRTAFQTAMTRRLRSFLLRRYGMAKKNGKIHDTDKIFNIKTCKKALDSACKRLNLPRYTTRSFRRVFIKRAIQAGVHPKAIAQTQGHQDGGKLILTTYSDDFDDQLDETARKLNAISA